MHLRGEYLIDTTNDYSLLGVPLMILSDDVNMKIRLNSSWGKTTLEFVTNWDTEKVARKPAIEKNCVDLPLAIMGKVQAVVERCLALDGMKADIIVDAIIDCHFDAINESRSECTPDIIQRVRDERMKHEEEE